jgi:hypothetical protein
MCNAPDYLIVDTRTRTVVEGRDARTLRWWRKTSPLDDVIGRRGSEATTSLNLSTDGDLRVAGTSRGVIEVSRRVTRLGEFSTHTAFVYMCMYIRMYLHSPGFLYSRRKIMILTLAPEDSFFKRG